jgi:hypothetical protein
MNPLADSGRFPAQTELRPKRKVVESMQDSPGVVIDISQQR